MSSSGMTKKRRTTLLNCYTATLSAYFSLLKPRVMSLVVFTGFVGLYLAPGSISFSKACLAILCIAIGSGAAGALNMWYERDSDALMERTKGRALPQELIPPHHALIFALTLAIGSVMAMGWGVNEVAAFYLAMAILFYVIIYTMWLKPRTPQNIVIGGAAGALPPVIGWAAVMHETALLPWILFGIIFLWTPPHFWALALNRQEEYRTAGIPMLPVVAGIETTRHKIFVYLIALILLTFLPVYEGDLGFFYGLTAGVLGVTFLVLGIRMKHSQDPKDNLRFFTFSILYLFLLFTAMGVDRALAYVF